MAAICNPALSKREITSHTILRHIVSGFKTTNVLCVSLIKYLITNKKCKSVINTFFLYVFKINIAY